MRSTEPAAADTYRQVAVRPARPRDRLLRVPAVRVHEIVAVIITAEHVGTVRGLRDHPYQPVVGGFTTGGSVVDAFVMLMKSGTGPVTFIPRANQLAAISRVEVDDIPP